MNRGRHKKNKKEDNIYSKDTILSCIRSELVELYRISKQQQIRTSDPSTYKARIYITSNPEREEPYLCIINCYINDIYYIDRSRISRLSICQAQGLSNKIAYGTIKRIWPMC